MDIGILILAGAGLVFLAFVVLFIRKQSAKSLPPPEADPEKVLADHAGKDSADLDPFPATEGAPVEGQPTTATSNENLRRGLDKTKKGFVKKLNDLLFGRGLDEG